MDIIRLIPDRRHNKFNTKSFLNAFEVEIPHMKRKELYTITEVTPMIQNKQAGSFYDLLSEIGVNKNLHNAVMKFNNMRGSSDYKGEEIFILLPDESYMSRLAGLISNKKITHK